MARVVRFHKTGGPEVLRLEEVDLPLPGAGEVQIRVHALGLNRAEAMFRSGTYLVEPQLPARLGYEAAGTVEAIGEGVEGYKPGDAVSVVPSFSMDKYGVYGDVATVPASALLSAKLIKNAQLKIYKGGSHGICATQKEQVNEDLLGFLREGRVTRAA